MSICDIVHFENIDSVSYGSGLLYKEGLKLRKSNTNISIIKWYYFDTTISHRHCHVKGNGATKWYEHLLKMYLMLATYLVIITIR